MPYYEIDNTKDGKQGYRVRINFTDTNGKSRTKAKIVYGLIEAKAEEQRMLASLNEIKNSSPKTIQNLYDEYITNKKYEVRETTLAKTISILNNHVLPTMNNIKLDKLNTALLQEWKNQINSKDLKISMKQNIYKEFRTMLNYAVKLDYLIKNPLSKIGNFKEIYFEKPQEKIKFYTPEEFKKFINIAEENATTPAAKSIYVFFNIAFYTGMRKGEINALKWSDMQDNIIHVRRSVSQKIKGKDIVETPPKNKTSYRDIQIPKQLIDILTEHKEYQKEMLNFSEDWRVCGGSKCISDTSLSDYNIEYAQKAKLKEITIHDFRHSHASLLANEGINIQEIARRLGHAKIEMTWNTYSHLYPREEERAIKVLENM